MRNPKHRWTLEEENALRAGVDKYGTGRWRNILTDEKFAPYFIARSNVDLKDKWRNLCSNASSRAASPQCSTDNETGHGYNTRNLEALSYTKNSVGLDVDAIQNYIENVVDEVGKVEVKVEEAVVQDYVQVLREVGYEENEINIVLEHTEVPQEEVVDEHGITMSMSIEGSDQDAYLINDAQEFTSKPKLLLKVIFKALKKLMSVLKTSIKKLVLKMLRSCKSHNVQSRYMIERNYLTSVNCSRFKKLFCYLMETHLCVRMNLISQ